jgi:hypothetical protein
MSMAVKPHQPFFLAARTDHARRPRADSRSRPCCPLEHAPLLQRRAAAGWPGGGENPVVGWRAFRSGHGARTTVYPCGTGQGPKHLLPCTPQASGTPPTRAYPSNERCLRRITRRHNGGSLRPGLPHRGHGGRAPDSPPRMVGPRCRSRARLRPSRLPLLWRAAAPSS